jgi:hypothetical protein
MRITTSSVENFLSNVGVADSVFNNVIYTERSRRHLNGKTPRDATSFQVFFQLSAVLNFADGGQALLVCGIDCGVDRTTADGDLEGTARLKELEEQVVGFCTENKLRLLPGVLDQ